MEPVDSDSYLKEVALSLAVQYSQHRPGITTYQVRDIADQFLVWLRKDA